MNFPKTAEEFFKKEVEDWGWDHVEAQFANGLEPRCINGVWLWKPVESVVPSSSSNSTVSNTPVNLIVRIS